MGHAIGETEFRERCRRVASADHGRARRRRHGLRDRPRPGGERPELEGPHRAVPEDRSRRGDLGGEQLARARADVEAHPPRRHGRVLRLPPRRRGGEPLRDHDVEREDQPAVRLLRLEHRLPRELHALGLDQRIAGRAALGAEEAEAHRSADEQHVGEVEEAVDQLDLVAHLGPAEDDDQRALRRLDHAVERAHLALEQRPRERREVLCHANGARVRAVGRAECVVDEQVGEPGELTREVGIVLRLTRLPARVLEDQHLTGLEPAHAAPHLGADDVGSLVHGATEQLAEALARRSQGRGGVAALRPVEVGGENESRTALTQKLDRGNRGADARVVGDPALGERDVEVDADERPLPRLDLRIAQRTLRESDRIHEERRVRFRPR